MPFPPSQSPCCSHPLSVAPLFLSAEAFFLAASFSRTQPARLPPPAIFLPLLLLVHGALVTAPLTWTRPPARDLSKPAPSPSVISSARHGSMVAGNPLRVFTSTPGSSLLGARPPG